MKYLKETFNNYFFRCWIFTVFTYTWGMVSVGGFMYAIGPSIIVALGILYRFIRSLLKKPLDKPV